jgi:hypothetical protein
MVLAGQFRRACAVGFLGAATASMGLFAATFDTEPGVITPDLQKIQFDSSGPSQLNHSDKVHASRTGGHTDVELLFDGKTSVVANKKDRLFTQADAPGIVDPPVGVNLPDADLWVSNP